MKPKHSLRRPELWLTGLCIFLLFSSSYAQEGIASEKSEISWFFLSIGLIGGLALFLYGMERMSDALRNVAGMLILYSIPQSGFRCCPT